MCFSRTISPHGRPRSPPRSLSASQAKSSSPAKPGEKVTSPPRQPYASLLAQSRGSFNDEDDNDDEEDDIVYDDDDDEDEFGLPSIASMRRKRTKPTRTFSSKLIDPGGGAGNKPNGTQNLSLAQDARRPRANSADIAEERGAPVYPIAKKSEGKILRPQYKEIRNGNSTLHLQDGNNLSNSLQILRTLLIS